MQRRSLSARSLSLSDCLRTLLMCACGGVWLCAREGASKTHHTSDRYKNTHMHALSKRKKHSLRTDVVIWLVLHEQLFCGKRGRNQQINATATATATRTTTRACMHIVRVSILILTFFHRSPLVFHSCINIRVARE